MAEKLLTETLNHKTNNQKKKQADKQQKETRLHVSVAERVMAHYIPFSTSDDKPAT